jgi:hypothetical protein
LQQHERQAMADDICRDGPHTCDHHSMVRSRKPAIAAATGAGAWHREQVGRAGDVGVLAGREPGVELLAALDEQRAALAAESGQHGAGDGRRLLRPEGPSRDAGHL